MIINIRVDHKMADVKTLEESAPRMAKIIKSLWKAGKIKECVSIKTCNRVEYYIVTDNFDENIFKNMDVIIEKNKKAILHLLRLASGLESMIIGETQILGQIKDAKLQAQNNGTCGDLLELIFNKAIHVGQVVRKKTKISEGSVSIGSAAVELAESICGSLENKKVLVVGAGEMGTLVAKSLADKNLEAILVANRTYDRAVKLAKELGGRAIRFEKLKDVIKDVDIIISATGAPHPVITRERIKKIPPERRKSVIIIDIANPRDVEEGVKDLGVNVFDIDSLRVIAEKNRKKREKEAEKAEKIIEEEMISLEKMLKHKEVEEIISKIRIKAEKIRNKEVKKALKMLETSNNPEKIFNDLTRSIINKLFHDITVKIRKAAEEDKKHVIEACEFLFT